MSDLICKIVIFGESGTGKTSLRKRFLINEFNSDSRKTIGVDFETKDLESGSKEIKLLIGDFAGEGRFRFMFPEYIYGAVGGILLYDITDKASFNHVKDWLSLIRETDQHFPIVLAGSKYDLDDIREISWEEGVETAKSIGMNGFIECSSKTGENVNELFSGLLKLMADRKIYDVHKIPTIKV